VRAWPRAVAWRAGSTLLAAAGDGIDVFVHRRWSGVDLSTLDEQGFSWLLAGLGSMAAVDAALDGRSPPAREQATVVLALLTPS
jgi:hypothetical protein